MTSFRIAATTSLLALAAATAAQAQEKVTFATNWLAQAEHGGFYQAVADGTYAACGLDVTILQGGPQVNGRAMLYAGKVDFFMGGSMLEAFFGVQEGIPTKAVAAMFQKEPQVIITHPGAAKSFEDLKNIKSLMIGDGGFASYYQWMISAFGFTVEQRVPYTFNAAPFLADKDSAMQGYLTSEPYMIEKEGGFTPDVYLIADAGYTSYSTTIEAMADTITSRPEVVSCFVDGSIKGWYTYLYGDNAAANDKIKADNPDMTDEMIAYGITKMKEAGIVDSGDAETLGIGVMTDARNKDFFDKMVAAGVLPAELDYKAAYTLDFVGKGVGLDLKK